DVDTGVRRWHGVTDSSRGWMQSMSNTTRPAAFSGGLPPMFVSTRRLLRMFVVALPLLAMASAALAQTRPAAPSAAAPRPAAIAAANTGSISGRVLENGKTPVPYANVQVTDLHTGALTDETGAFIIKGLPAGVHTLKASPLGYSAAVQNVTVIAGQTAAVTFT